MKVVVFAKRSQRQLFMYFGTALMCLFFWQNVLSLIVGNIDENVILLWKDVLLGIVNLKDKKKPCTYFIIFLFWWLNFTFINAIFLGKRPCFIAFKSEVKLYIESILTSTKQKEFYKYVPLVKYFCNTICTAPYHLKSIFLLFVLLFLQ